MKNLLKKIVGNFTRMPVTNSINLLGLSTSLAMVIILSVYCYSEITTDKYHKNGERVYLYLPSNDRIYSPGILKKTIDMKVPGVESTLRISGAWEPSVFQAENRDPITSDLLFADKDFFNFFSYDIIEGDLESALEEPLTIVITKTLSDKLFGSNKAVGKTIKLNNSTELMVKAIINEPKANSCLSFSAVTSVATQKIIQNDDGIYTEWGWCDFQTFLLLEKRTNPVALAQTILDIIPEEYQKDYKNAKLMPLKKIYFSQFLLLGNGYLISGDKNKVILLLIVAALVLLIALINFINISSSQWLESIRQTGIMKIYGANRSTILLNILSESFLFFLAALLMACLLVNFINPFIQGYTGIRFSQKLTYSSGFILVALASILFLSIIFSIFPALKISSSKGIDNLKNTVKPNKTNFSFSAILVTMQFTIAIALIAFTALIQKQVRFGSRNLGYNQKNIIGIKLTPQLNQKKEILRDILLEKPAIDKVAFTQFYPGKDISQWRTQLDLNGEKKVLDFDTFSADAGFLTIMGLQLTMGRFFNSDLSTDKGKVLVNETFLHQHHYTSPIGGTFTMGKRDFEIIGVVRDFHYKPVNQPIAPLMIRNESYASYCLVNLNAVSSKSLHATIQEIKAATSGLSPSFPVDLDFFDQAVEKMYQSELRFRHTFSLFAGCAIVICCLGILAMSLITCKRRIKEIGIRKVNGATISEILVMLNKNFLRWVTIAFIIACPFAWYAMRKWLLNFAYKTDISWWIFGLAGLIALSIAFLTVSLQSFRAAARNPVESLRYE